MAKIDLRMHILKQSWVQIPSYLMHFCQSLHCMQVMEKIVPIPKVPMEQTLLMLGAFYSPSSKFS